MMSSDMPKVVPDGDFKTTAQHGWKFTAEGSASLLFFVALWLFWSFRYGNYLYAAQENSIFLYRLDFLTRWLGSPDGLLCYLTAFVIQFFYYPILGGAIFSALCVAVQLYVAKLFKTTGSKYAISFIPSCLIVIATTWPAYYVFIPFNVTLIFSEPIALLFAFGVLSIFKRFKTYRSRLFFALVFVPIAFRFMGVWASIACLFCAIDELTRRENGVKLDSRNYVRALWLVLAAVLIPIAEQHFWLFPRLQLRNVFTCGLIEEVRYDRDAVTAFFTYRLVEAIPIILLLAYFCARFINGRVDRSAALLKKMERAQKRLQALKEKKESRKGGNRERNNNSASVPAESKEEFELKQKREIRKKEVLLTFELIFLLCSATVLLSYHTRAYFDSLQQLQALENADWERILEIDALNPCPISLMVDMRNLALYKTGRLAEEAFLRPIAGKSTYTFTVEEYDKAVSGNLWAKLKFKLFNLKQIAEGNSYRSLCELGFVHWGLTNIGARIAMDNLVATEDRSISYTKTLALAAAVNGERELARRYYRELSDTLFYKRSALIGMAYLDSAGFYQGVRDAHNDVEYAEAQEKARREFVGVTMEEAAEKYGVDVEDIQKYASTIADIRTERPECNHVTKKAYPDITFLLDVIGLGDYDKIPLKKKELLLVSALMQKKPEPFMEHIEDYFKLKGCEKGGAPRAIEQGYATWRYSLYGEEKWKDCEYQFTPETLETMEVFIKYTTMFGISGGAVQATLRSSFQGYYCGYVVDESTF